MLKTSKFHIENYIFWPFIRFFWEPFSGKRSHWWNWSPINKNFNYFVSTDGDNSLHPLTNVWHKLIQLNFNWNKLIILEPLNYKGSYQLAYKNSKTEICSIIVKGKIACLVGDKKIKYTGFSYPSQKEIQLKIVGYTKKSELPKDILFL